MRKNSAKLHRAVLLENLESRTLMSVTTFTVNPALSSLTLSGSSVGYSLSAQVAGSLTASEFGTIVADVNPSTIQFTNASSVKANLNADKTLNPGSSPANFAGKASTLFGDVLVALRNIAINAKSAVLPITAGTFSSTGETFTVLTGTADYEAPFVGTGSKSLVGLSSANKGASASKLVISASGLETLTVPVSITLTYSAVSTNDSVLTFTGQVVATAQQAAKPKLIFASQPKAAIAGSKLGSFEVDVDDSTGKPITTDSSTVTLSIASGPTGAKLGGTFSVKAVKGKAIFTGVVLTKAGSYTLKATDGTVTAAVSTSFKITAATAAKLVFVKQPPSGKVGIVLSPAPTVAVEDKYGNIVTTNSSKATLTLASGTAGALTGTLIVGDSVGIFTFTKLKLTKAGKYTLKAIDGVLTSAISSSFMVA